MKIADTISVNPGKETLGHSALPANTIFRQSVLNKEKERVNILTLLFPTVKSGSSEFVKYALPLRSVFATILILTGLTTLLSAGAPLPYGLSVCSLVFGGFLAFGLLTRPLMIGAAAYYAICSALSLRMGNADILSLSLMFGSMIFSIYGSGKYSCDFLIRKTVRRHKISSRRKRSENALTYKAFKYSRY